MIAFGQPAPASSLLSGLLEHFELQAEIDQLAPAIYANGPAKWGAIRRLYELIGDDHDDRYPIDWTRIFTPIEAAIWEESHYLCGQLLPQYPVGKCFVDFALPKKRIAIECDGRAYHDHVSDAERDRYLGSLGWTVYRISGSDCKRMLETPWDTIADRQLDGESDEARQIVREWLRSTAEGLIASIAAVHFARPVCRYSYFKDYARDLLEMRSWMRW